MRLTIYFLLICAFLMTGCKAKRLLKLAVKCKEQFPVKNEMHIDTLYRTDTIILPDTYYEYIDTTDCPPSDSGTIVYKTVNRILKGKTIYLPRIIHDTTFIKTDSAALYRAQRQLEEMRKGNEKLEKELIRARQKQKKKEQKNNGLKVPWWIWLFLTIIGGAAWREVLKKQNK